MLLLLQFFIYYYLINLEHKNNRFWVGIWSQFEFSSTTSHLLWFTSICCSRLALLLLLKSPVSLKCCFKILFQIISLNSKRTWAYFEATFKNFSYQSQACIQKMIFEFSIKFNHKNSNVVPALKRSIMDDDRGTQITSLMYLQQKKLIFRKNIFKNFWCFLELISGKSYFGNEVCLLIFMIFLLQKSATK